MKQLPVAAILLLSLAATTVAEEAKSYLAEMAVPILQQHCFDCHGPEKQKADLRLDTKEGLLEHVVVPGEPEESELLTRIVLPADDDDRMPPQGDGLTPLEIQVIKAWIATGADWPTTLVTATTKPESARRKMAIELLPAVEATAAEAAAIEELAALGIHVRPVALNLVWKTANLRDIPRDRLTAALEPLSRITTLTDLNLADNDLTNDDVKKLSSLVYLTRLHLEKNPITDAALIHLAPLTHLDYLNLYATNVGDAGLVHLHGLKQLRKLYLWQSKVTDEGEAALQIAMPDLEIVRNVNLPEPVPPEAEEEKEAQGEAE